MILNDLEIKDLLNKHNIIDFEMMDLVQTYIKDKTGHVIPIKRPLEPFGIQLLHIAYNKSTEFYIRKLQYLEA